MVFNFSEHVFIIIIINIIIFISLFVQCYILLFSQQLGVCVTISLQCYVGLLIQETLCKEQWQVDKKNFTNYPSFMLSIPSLFFFIIWIRK